MDVQEGLTFLNFRPSTFKDEEISRGIFSLTPMDSQFNEWPSTFIADNPVKQVGVIKSFVFFEHFCNHGMVLVMHPNHDSDS